MKQTNFFLTFLFSLLLANLPLYAEVNLNGYADIEYKNFVGQSFGFDQHRLVLNIGANLHPRLNLYSEFEIEHGGPDASGGGEAKIEQAWISYAINDLINLRFGALLVPFSRYNLYHDSHFNPLTDRPLLARNIVPTTWTESGAGIYGELPLEMVNSLSYELYLINGLNDNLSTKGLKNSRGKLSSDNNNQSAIVGRLVANPLTNLETGLSYYQGEYSTNQDAINGIGIDLAYKFQGINLISEIARFTESNNSNNLFQGYYFQATYNFWPEFLNNTFLKTDFDHPLLALVFRRDFIQIKYNSVENKESRYTLGFNYQPEKNFIFKIEYQINSTTNQILEHGNTDGIISSVAIGF